MNTLIIEDNQMNQELMQELLNPYGSCEVAADGALGVRAFKAAHARRKPFDLICLDIMMPNQNGHITLQSIRQHELEMEIRPRDRVRIVMTTALHDKENVMKAIGIGGADGYLIKPIKEDRLLETIRNLGLID